MPRMTRRSFVLSSAAVPLDCMIRPLFAASQSAGDHSTPEVRQPLTGQFWHYAKHDGYTGEFIADETDRIASVGRSVEIKSRSDAGEHAEIQQPWGMILVDPHWASVQVYTKAIPLWPAQLEPGWRSVVNTRYQTPDTTPLPWQQTMKAHGWEHITVPAGRFLALRYTNWVNYFHGDFSMTNAVRAETLWLAPELGRWVARESRGYYYDDASVVGQPINEDSHRWELLDWA